MEELPWRFRRGKRCEGYALGVGIHGLEFNELEKYVFRRGRGFLGQVHYEGEGVCDFCREVRREVVNGNMGEGTSRDGRE